MVNHLLETRHPLASSVLRLRVSVAVPSFHSPYTLPSSVSRNSFVCRSYENTRGVGGYSSHFGTQRSHSSLSTAHYPLPTLFMYENTRGVGGILPKLEPLSRPQASTPLRAIIDFAACASAKKASWV